MFTLPDAVQISRGKSGLLPSTEKRERKGKKAKMLH